MAHELPPRHIFRAYDIRGVVGESLTPGGVYAIGRAIGSEARERGVACIALGRDGRLSGLTLCERLRQGILEAGVNVVDIGQVTTPMLYFAATTACGGSGVMLTGSHNPPEYNGIKVMLGGETLAGEAVAALHERIRNRRLANDGGRCRDEDVYPAYAERIRADVALARPMKVVVDGGNGVAGGYGSQLLQALGCEVIEQYCEVDGSFPHHHPDPNRPENLADLIAAVRELGADLGIAFDGDGDRIGMVDEQGRIIWPDRLMMYLADRLLAANPGATVIYDVKCSRALGEVIREAGGKALMWKSGHSYAKAKLKQTGAILAGELSGHLFFNDHWYGFDDGIYAAARLLELLSKEGEPASAVFARYPEPVSTPELQLPMAEGEAEALVEALTRHIPFDDALVFSVDGLRVEFRSGWALVRASNTTPSLVLRFEADDETALRTIQQRIRDWLLAVRPGLALPF
jgi:phosphomannomutase/phosphoglucomutase